MNCQSFEGQKGQNSERKRVKAIKKHLTKILWRPKKTASNSGVSRVAQLIVVCEQAGHYILGLVLLCLFTLSAFGQGGSISSGGILVLSPLGRPIGGATVTLCAFGATGIPCSPTITVYTDPTLSTPASNPATSDGNGNVFVYAAPGRYTYTVTGTGITGKSFTATVAGSGGGDVGTSLNNVLTGNNTFSGTSTLAQVNKTFYADGVTNTTIQAAINAAPSGATVIVPAGCSGTVAAPPATITISQAVHLIIQCDVTSSQSPNISILSSGVTIEGNGDNSRPANGTNAATWTNSGSGNTIIYGDGTQAYRGLIIDRLNFLKSTPATSANIKFRANAADITVRDLVLDGLGFEATEGNQELNRFERVRVNRAVNVAFNYNCVIVCNSVVFDSTYAASTSGTGIGYDMGNINATLKASDADGGAIGYRFVGVGQVVWLGNDDENNSTAGIQITGATGQATLLSPKAGAEVLPISITGAASVTIINPFTTGTSGANSISVSAGGTGQNLLIADSGLDKPILITAPGSMQRMGSLTSLQGPLGLLNVTSAPAANLPIDSVSLGANLRLSDTHAGGCNWDFGELFGVTVLDLRAVSCGGGGVAFNSNSAAGRAIVTFNNSVDRIFNLPNAAAVGPSFLNCGTTSVCAQTNQTRLIVVNGGPIALAAGTLTVTSLPFTSSTSYTCSADDSTGINGIDVVYVSGASVTFNGTGTDSIRYACQGN